MSAAQSSVVVRVVLPRGDRRAHRVGRAQDKGGGAMSAPDFLTLERWAGMAVTAAEDCRTRVIALRSWPDDPRRLASIQRLDELAAQWDRIAEHFVELRGHSRYQ